MRIIESRLRCMPAPEIQVTTEYAEYAEASVLSAPLW
jgi:hypothetical protein